ncbi:hypothetical protein MXD62_01485 [Frankia sp. Mgl5]|uniref:hypothetical protein n=1 Tax=Frankia sp. Mgl5 TaxID=2933793 RepID=UPI00200E4A90|nr:hypothetical protein [Frankia sp. Mgl5]MCK9925842.1 hypothetical protein [Frankia sp. Mgl5]
MTASPDAASHASPVAPPRALARRAIVGVVTGFYLASALANVLPAGPVHAVAGAGAVLGLVLGVLTVRHPRLSNPLLGAALGALAGYVAHSAYPVGSALSGDNFRYDDGYDLDFGYGPASWMLLGAGVGAAVATAVGRGSRLASPLLGVVLGGLAGHLTEFACRAGDATFDSDYGLRQFAGGGTPTTVIDGYGPLYTAAGSALGLLLGLVAHGRPRWKTASLGLAFGVLAGSLGSAASRTSYATFDAAGNWHSLGFVGGAVAGFRPVVWIAAAAVIGLLLGVLASRFSSFVVPCSGLTAGAFFGYVVCSAMRSTYTFGSDVALAEPASQAGSAIQVVVQGPGPVIGMAAGAVFGLCFGVNAIFRFRLAASGLGLAVGAAVGIAVASAYQNFRNLQAAPSAPADDYVPLVVLGAGMVLGTVLGPFADRRPRLARPLAGVALGVVVGYVASSALAAAYLLAVHYDYQHPSDTSYAAAVGVTVGAVVGLALGLLANPRTRCVTTVLGLALGLLGGEAASLAVQFLVPEHSGDSYARNYVYIELGCCGVGAAAGLVLGAFTHRHPLRGRPCFGALAGAFIGSTVWLLFPGAPPTETVAVSAVVGAVAIARRPSSGWGLVPAGGGVHRTGLSARQLARELRPGAFAHGLVWAAAAVAADDRRQERYAEEFRATLAEITGPLACPRRLWCSLTIFANAALLRAELGRAAETGADQPPNHSDVADGGSDKATTTDN